jgi:hypothetical protein
MWGCERLCVEKIEARKQKGEDPGKVNAEAGDFESER